MLLMGRSIAMLLVLALTGGAQACVALCALPAPTAKNEPACRHCSQKESQNSPAPAAPCKHCQVISQERWATQGDQPFNVGFDWTAILLFDPAPSIVHGHQAPVTSPERAHAPPGEQLHQFCLLLI
jgi:hypothetical protein